MIRSVVTNFTDGFSGRLRKRRFHNLLSLPKGKYCEAPRLEVQSYQPQSGFFIKEEETRPCKTKVALCHLICWPFVTKLISWPLLLKQGQLHSRLAGGLFFVGGGIHDGSIGHTGTEGHRPCGRSMYTMREKRKKQERNVQVSFKSYKKEWSHVNYFLSCHHYSRWYCFLLRIIFLSLIVFIWLLILTYFIINYPLVYCDWICVLLTFYGEWKPLNVRLRW